MDWSRFIFATGSTDDATGAVIDGCAATSSSPACRARPQFAQCRRRFWLQAQAVMVASGGIGANPIRPEDWPRAAGQRRPSA